MSLDLKPDLQIEAIRGSISARVRELASSLRAENFGSVCDSVVRALLRDGFTRANADEGSVWLMDEEGTALVMAYNSGPNAAKMVGVARQPLSSGVVSLSAVSEQAFLEVSADQGTRLSRQVDDQFHQRTLSLIAVPLYLQRVCHGVLSCVQLTEIEGRPRFEPRDLVVMQHLGAVLDDLLDYRLLARAVGWRLG